MGYIYLASPYSDPDPDVVESRHQTAMQAAVWFLRHKIWVYSPIVHCHDLAKLHALPTSFDYWSSYNETMLCGADYLYILCIPGWEKSKGIRGEWQFATLNDIPIFYVLPVGPSGWQVRTLAPILYPCPH